MIEYPLTEMQQELQSLAKEIAEKEIKPVREKYDETEEFAHPILEMLAEAGFFGIYFDEKYGGTGGGVLDLVVVVEQISRVDCAIATSFAANSLGTFPIMLGGSEEMKQKYLPEIAQGKKYVAFGLTEANAGSDALAMQTTAKEDGDHYILNGTKQWITNGGVADIYSIFAKTNPSKGARGITGFVVEKGTPGFSFGKKEKKMGIRSSMTTELIFENCKIPKENVIGKPGMGVPIAIGTLNVSRPGVASQAVGLAQGALDSAVTYAKERQQFGQKIIGFQSIQHMLADMAMQVEAARGLVYNVARTIDNGGKNYAMYSAMSKCYASDVAMKVATDAVQIAGGYGYMREYPFEKYMRDAKILQIYEGTNQVQRNEIALGLIKKNVQF